MSNFFYRNTEKTNRGFLSLSNVIPGLTRNPEYLLMNFRMPDQVRHDASGLVKLFQT